MDKYEKNFNWDDLRYFSALAQCQTVSSASKKLGVNYVTVSRHIDRLEEALQKPLFERSRDGYFLTIDGEYLYQKMSSIQENIEELSHIFDNSLRYKRSIKLSMVHSLAELIVIPQLSKLQSQYPELRLDIHISSRNVNVVKREADIAIRFDLPKTGECISRKLADLEYYLCGIPDLVAKYKKGEFVPVITYSNNLSHLPESKFMLSTFGAESVRLQTDSATVQLKAAEEGVGLALLPSYLFKSSNLEKIEMPEPVDKEIWLLVRKNVSEISGVRLVMDLLIKNFKDEFLRE